ncbi:nucleotidyl transferase AbiEii/AbiGii toxin family protein [Pseudoflavitalea rhizosphaerae]|uniref:nucleotidyl transferase AbiEii/AbiGii toxin family protein n=1 Tax=Pseudoflavitalea rhizosphaerae TaxID=1884793 RepID=UPI000F8EA419|nr:nucleotidyl transferase AbiEii/AbiGii toxin family protein [Pseudoflavitalea rhizosphaerae]
MQKWLNLPPERKIEIINQVNAQTGFSVEAIEKDWWVTLALKAVFATQWSENLVFKGGTSLSKGWRLITRFSEDIDLAMDRSVLGFNDPTPNPSQVEKLRQASAEFMGGPFREALEAAIRAMEISPDALAVVATEIKQANEDPRQIELQYTSLFNVEQQKAPGYVRPKVIVEIGARSLKEPFAPRPITSLITEHFPTATFSVKEFEVPTVEPQRTILEKLFLLYEENTKPLKKRKTLRYSRHLSDVHATKDYEPLLEAMASPDLFNTIRMHRKTFNKVSGVQYDTLQFNQLDFLPADESLTDWEHDYAQMQESMIGSNPPSFATMMEGLRLFHQQVKTAKF